MTDGPVAPEAPLIAIVDYGIGNMHSAVKGFERVGADARLTDDAALIADAAGVVLPGVGAFGSCIAALRSRKLDDVVLRSIGNGQPFFGICIGMQLLYEGSDEAPGQPGLGVLPGSVRLLPDQVKRPQMQWNRLVAIQPSLLTAGLDDPWMYFVHSYAAENTDHCVATCDYGGPVVAAVERDNVWAAQFHPEKSGPVGLAVLANFLRLASGEPVLAGETPSASSAGAPS